MEPHRRSGDFTKRVILYGSLVTAVTAIITVMAYGAKAYVRLSDAVDAVPQHARRLDEFERWKEMEQERTDNILWWMSQIGKKLGVPAPPPRLSRSYERGREE